MPSSVFVLEICCFQIFSLYQYQYTGHKEGEGVNAVRNSGRFFDFLRTLQKLFLITSGESNFFFFLNNKLRILNAPPLHLTSD